MISDVWPDRYVAARARNFDSYVALQLATRGFRIWAWTGIAGAIIALCSIYKVLTPQREISDIASISLGTSFILIGFRIALAWDQYICKLDDRLGGKKQNEARRCIPHSATIEPYKKHIIKSICNLRKSTESTSDEDITDGKFETAIEIFPSYSEGSGRHRNYEPPIGSYEIKYQFANDRSRTMYKFVNGATSDADAVDRFKRAIFDSSMDPHATAIILGIRRW